MQVKQTFISTPMMIISLALNLQYQHVFLTVMHILSVVSELCILCLGLLCLWPFVRCMEFWPGHIIWETDYISIPRWKDM